MVQGAKAELSDEVASLKSDLAAVKNDLGDIVHTLSASGRNTAVAVKDSIGEGVESSLTTVRTQIEERPLTSLAVAFGAGFLISKLLSR